MGIIRFVNALSKTTKGVIVSARKQQYDYVYVDFNSIIHNASKTICDRLTQIKQGILQGDVSIDYDSITDNKRVAFKVERFGGSDNIQQNIKDFEERLLVHIDRHIIGQVIFDLESVLRDYTEYARLKHIYLAIDGVPHKAKMMEQRARKYGGYIISLVESKIR